MISPGDKKLFHVVDAAKEGRAVLAAHYGFDKPPTRTGHFADDV
jgi:hypothetical protein